MFFSAVQTYIIGILIAVVILQYAFALFCLLKLAYFDLTKNQYILWNIFILVVFFIGGIVFLVYYYKHPEKLIQKRTDVPDRQADGTAEAEKPEADDAVSAPPQDTQAESMEAPQQFEGDGEDAE